MGDLRMQDFDGDGTIEHGVDATVDGTHAACAELLEDFVMGYGSAVHLESSRPGREANFASFGQRPDVRGSETEAEDADGYVVGGVLLTSEFDKKGTRLSRIFVQHHVPYCFIRHNGGQAIGAEDKAIADLQGNGIEPAGDLDVGMKAQGALQDSSASERRLRSG